MVKQSVGLFLAILRAAMLRRRVVALNAPVLKDVF